MVRELEIGTQLHNSETHEVIKAIALVQGVGVASMNIIVSGARLGYRVSIVEVVVIHNINSASGKCQLLEHRYIQVLQAYTHSEPMAERFLGGFRLCLVLESLVS